MSTPIDRESDLDPVLKYAPRRVRDGSVWTAAASQAVPAQPDIAPVALDKRRAFSGDRAAQELFRQLRLNPATVPEPVVDEGVSFRPFLVRLATIVAAAATIAALIVVLPTTTKSVQAPRPSAIPNAAAAAQPPSPRPVKLARLNPAEHVKFEDRLPVEANLQIGTSSAPQDEPPRAQEAVAVTAYVTRQEGPAISAESASALPAQTSPPAPQDIAANGSAQSMPPVPADAQRGTVRNEHALEPEQIAMLIAQARNLMQTGDLAAARVLLQRAAEADSADAALALGGTFDPAVIQQLGALGMRPDAARARQWYERAAALGSAAASKKLAEFAPDNR